MGCKEIVCKYLPELGRSTERSKKNLCDRLSNCKYAREFFKKKADRASTVGFKDGVRRERNEKCALCVTFPSRLFFFEECGKREKGEKIMLTHIRAYKKATYSSFAFEQCRGSIKFAETEGRKRTFYMREFK